MKFSSKLEAQKLLMFTLFKHIKRIHGLSEIYLAISEDTRCFKS